MIAESNLNRITVLFIREGYLPSEGTILSFLFACEEEELCKSMDNVVKAREVLPYIHLEARKIFRDKSILPFQQPFGWTRRSLRKRLRYGGSFVSLWWYHVLSQKSTVEPGFAYNDIIRLMIIDKVATQRGSKDIVLIGAPEAYAHCLGQKYNIVGHKLKSVKQSSIRKKLGYIKRSVSGRFDSFKNLWAIATHHQKLKCGESAEAKVLMQAYWPWSIKVDEDGSIREGYFRNFPDRLESEGISYGFLCTSDINSTGLIRSNRSIGNQGRMIFIEGYFSKLMLLLLLFDLRPVLNIIRALISSTFRGLYKENGLYLLPLFRESLLAGALNYSIPRQLLRENAARKIFKKYNTKYFLSSLEFFLDSRAIYSAARSLSNSGGKKVICIGAQHAIINEDKAFQLIDKDFERMGVSDNCPMPAPDYLFAMSEESEKLWLKYGYSADEIFVTGGLRYDHLRSVKIMQSERFSHDAKYILLVGGMNVCQDFDMAQAVCCAMQSVENIQIGFRDHPLYPVFDFEIFESLRPCIKKSTQSLEEELLRADVIVFTHTSVAEEALVRGIPAIMWLWPGVQSSALYKDDGSAMVPAFSSVRDLALELKRVLSAPRKSLLNDSEREFFKNRFYGNNPGDAPENTLKAMYKIMDFENNKVRAKHG